MAVPLVHSHEKGLGSFVEPVFLSSFFEDASGEHRGKRKRHEGGDDDSAGNDHPKLAKQPSGRASEKKDGQEHRHECQGSSNHGKKDLFGAQDPRFDDWQASLHLGVNILEYHNGVVHHQTDRQHDRQQGEYIDTKAGHIHHKERTDEGDGNNNHRNQCSSKIPQKEENHKNHQAKRNKNSLLYLGDGILNVFGRVEANRQRDILWQIFFDPFNAFEKLLGDVELVGSGLGNRHHPHHRHSVPLQHRAFVSRTQLGPSNITKPNLVATALFHNHVVEILRRGQAAHRTY